MTTQIKRWRGHNVELVETAQFVAAEQMRRNQAEMMKIAEGQTVTLTELTAVLAVNTDVLAEISRTLANIKVEK